MEERMAIENRYHDWTALPSTNVLGKNLIGTFLMLVISLLITGIILAPDIARLFRTAMFSQSTLAWIAVFGSILLAGFLIAFPIFLIVQGFIYYRDARKLDRIGIWTRGLVMEKWADTSDGNPVYHICYKYLLDMDALQTVSENIFRQLECDQSTDVLHLEHAPQVSRMLLESYETRTYLALLKSSTKFKVCKGCKQALKLELASLVWLRNDLAHVSRVLVSPQRLLFQ